MLLAMRSDGIADSADSADFETLSVHLGREDLRELGVHALPIDLSTTAPLPTVEAGRDAYDLLAEGKPLPAGVTTVYRRAWNSTVARFEKAIAPLEGFRAGEKPLVTEAVAFASGMAAISAVLIATVASGKPHVIAIRPIYGGTDALLNAGLLGTQVSYVDVESLPGAITEKTGLIIVESPCNPDLKLHNISQVVEIAGSIPVMVDNTFASPVLQRPLTLGASYSVHSATKYIGGHGDAMGGVVISSPELAAQLRPIRTLTGGVLDPFTAYLFHRGIATMQLRVLAAQERAGEIATWLNGNAKVARVHYPGLAGQDPDGLIGKQMFGPGAMVSFEVHGGLGAAATLCRSLKLITHAVSLGGVDTLIENPASLTHRVVVDGARPVEGLLRMSVGLESAKDLIADLSQALEKI